MIKRANGHSRNQATRKPKLGLKGSVCPGSQTRVQPPARVPHSVLRCQVPFSFPKLALNPLMTTFSCAALMNSRNWLRSFNFVVSKSSPTRRCPRIPGPRERAGVTALSCREGAAVQAAGYSSPSPRERAGVRVLSQTSFGADFPWHRSPVVGSRRPPLFSFLANRTLKLCHTPPEGGTARRKWKSRGRFHSVSFLKYVATTWQFFGSLASMLAPEMRKPPGPREALHSFDQLSRSGASLIPHLSSLLSCRHPSFFRVLATDLNVKTGLMR